MARDRLPGENDHDGDRKHTDKDGNHRTDDFYSHLPTSVMNRVSLACRLPSRKGLLNGDSISKLSIPVYDFEIAAAK